MKLLSLQETLHVYHLHGFITVKLSDESGRHFKIKVNVMSLRGMYIPETNTPAGLLIPFYICFHHIRRVALLLSAVQSGYH